MQLQKIFDHMWFYIIYNYAGLPPHDQTLIITLSKKKA